MICLRTMQSIFARKKCSAKRGIIIFDKQFSKLQIKVITHNNEVARKLTELYKLAFEVEQHLQNIGLGSAYTRRNILLIPVLLLKYCYEHKYR